MAKPNERTLKMMESFMSLHREGHDVNEIAKMFGLSYSTVYKRLGEIAEKEGVTREELLEKVIVADHSGRNIEPLKPIDRTQFNKNYQDAVASVDYLKKELTKTIDKIDDFIKEETE